MLIRSQDKRMIVNFGNMFTFVRNNEEPWSIAELQKLEVEE